MRSLNWGILNRIISHQVEANKDCIVHLIIGHALFNDIGLQLSQRSVGAVVFNCLSQFIPKVCTLSYGLQFKVKVYTLVVTSELALREGGLN